MLSLWIFAGLSFIAAVLYGFYFVHQTPSIPRKLCKVAAVGSLTVISALSGAPLLLTVALLLGTVGDAFLAWHGTRNFLAGLGAFLLGHLAYIGLLAEYSGGGVPFAEDPWRLLAALALVGATIKVVQQLHPHLGDMRLPVLVYAVVILAMGLTALTLPLTWPLGLAIPGSTLFIASDAILGFELFVFNDRDRRKGWPATLLWVLYWGGQTLILIAILGG